MILSGFSFMRQNHLDLVITLLFLIFPTVYTHMWLTTIQLYYAACLSLLFGFLLMRFARSGNWLTLGIAVLSLSLSFGFYEAQLGIAYAWALILAAFPKTPGKRRIAILITLTVIAGGFVLWRTLGIRMVGVDDPYLSRINVKPAALLFDILNGYKINLVWGWTTTIQQLLPWIPGAKYAFLFLGIVILILWYLMRNLLDHEFIKTSKTSKPQVTADGLVEHWVHIRPYVILCLLGLGLIGVGYIPVLVLYLPNLSGLTSRVNLFASFGGAIFLASILMIGSILFAQNQRQIRYLFIIAVVPFMVLGIVTQAMVQYDNGNAWHEQQNIWRQLFSIAPNFEDNTEVLFILPGYQDRTGYQNWKHTPLSSWWEVSSAVRLLYNNPTLSGDVIFPDIVGDNEPSLTPQGIITQGSSDVVPYAHLTAFIYDNKTGILRQLDSLPPDLVPGEENPVKLGTGQRLG